jgi:predicted DNA-binding transcriptional regulator AlpA
MSQSSISPRLLTEIQAAIYLGVSRQFLRKGRMEGHRPNHAERPPFIKSGRMVRYAIADLDEWIARHRKEVGTTPS